MGSQNVLRRVFVQIVLGFTRESHVLRFPIVVLYVDPKSIRSRGVQCKEIEGVFDVINWVMSSIIVDIFLWRRMWDSCMNISKC